MDPTQLKLDISKAVQEREKRLSRKLEENEGKALKYLDNILGIEGSTEIKDKNTQNILSVEEQNELSLTRSCKSDSEPLEMNSRPNLKKAYKAENLASTSQDDINPYIEMGDRLSKNTIDNIPTRSHSIHRLSNKKVSETPSVSGVIKTKSAQNTLSTSPYKKKNIQRSRESMSDIYEITTDSKIHENIKVVDKSLTCDCSSMKRLLSLIVLFFCYLAIAIGLIFFILFLGGLFLYIYNKKYFMEYIGIKNPESEDSA
ncbi:hypothetical protein NERG_00736 [Nematocida ausubeli]|uniref:Uncharacterized protein n=1 Tax=Nematocida ausubeli (strain ATCC PRA-371 / ERTm2) TaxID=1913371 RepID=H8ZAY7_NEMA1|nr:hypothetical protein NERG_00736 [Nematocida ausubeli]